MNKYIFLLALISLAVAPSVTLAAGWGTQEFNPTREINAGIICGQVTNCPVEDEDVGYMVGGGGTVYKTTDAGKSWFGSTGQGSQGSYIGTDKTLNSLSIQQTGVVVVVGQDGLIGWSENEGLNWSFFTSPTTKDLNGVVHVDYQHSFAVGDDGVIIGVLGNYGTAWTNISSPTSNDLIELTYSPITRQLMAVGENGVMVISEDLGMTWTLMDSPTSEDLIAVDVINSQDYFVASRVQIFSTTDGGETWETNDLPSDVDVEDIDFLNSNDGVLAGTYDAPNSAAAYNYVTDDGGDTWETLPVYGEDNNSLWLHDVHYEDANTLYGFGFSDYHNSITYGGFYRYAFGSSALVKLQCTDADSDPNAPCKAIYYVGTDGKRHAFDNEKVFKSWYDNFDDVITVDSDYLASLPLGDMVTYRPGEKLVKFPSSAKVYAVAGGGVLREVTSESIARSLYGSSWNTKVDDISEAFFGHYEIGETIESADDYDISNEQSAASTISEERGW